MLAGNDARDLATSLITILEGAHVLARATGGIDSFDETARVVTWHSSSTSTQARASGEKPAG